MLFVEGFGVCIILLLGNSFRWWSEVAATHSSRREKLLRSPGESLRRNLEQLNEYLIYSVAVFLLVPTLFALRRVRPPRDDERQEELPSLHSTVSGFPRSGVHPYPVEDTAPSILTRRPEWDTQ